MLPKIRDKIYEIRNQKVLLDYDLADLYKVETRILNQAVKRNNSRFPRDFMFQLTAKEWEDMSSQIVMTSASKRPKSALPYAFTEQGVAMLSGVLNSKKAIDVNIAIMRAFVFLREYALTHTDLTKKLLELEEKYNRKFIDVYEAINYLLKKDKQPEQVKPGERKQIGYKK